MVSLGLVSFGIFNHVIYFLFGGIVAKENLTTSVILIIGGCLLGVVLYVFGVWSAGDAKLFWGFSVAAPPMLFTTVQSSGNTLPLMMLENIFVVYLIFILLNLLLKTSLREKISVFIESIKNNESLKSSLESAFLSLPYFLLLIRGGSLLIGRYVFPYISPMIFGVFAILFIIFCNQLIEKHGLEKYRNFISPLCLIGVLLTPSLRILYLILVPIIFFVAFLLRPFIWQIGQKVYIRDLNFNALTQGTIPVFTHIRVNLKEVKMRIQLKPLGNLSKIIFFFFCFCVVGLVGMMRCAEAQIAFASGSHRNLDIYMMAPDGKDVQQLTHHGEDDWGPTWSPDGGQIAFTSARAGFFFDIYVMTVDKGKPINLTHHAGDDDNPVWSPDGQWIAFSSWRDGNLDIYLMYPDGTNLMRLTDHSRPDWNPAWSPDGAQIAFESVRIFGSDIFVMNANGTNIKRVTDAREQDTQPAWSPDGTQIAFASYRDHLFDIYIINVDGTDETNLTNSKFEDTDPTWAPNGQQIAYTSKRAGIYGIYVMNADGSEVVGITEELKEAINPEWGARQLTVYSKRKLSTLWARIKSR